MVDPRLIATLPVFAHLPSDALASLASRALERRYSAGQTLYLAGTVPSGLLLIIEGRVRVVRGTGNRQHLIHEEGPGGALGEVPVFGGGTYPATAIAAEPTRCILLLTEALQAAARTDPSTALAFLRRLGERTRHLVDRVDRLATQDVNGRLAGFLLDRQAAAGPDEPFTLGRTQLEVAEELGTVREVLVRALRQLRQAGLIHSPARGRYLVRDSRALSRLVNWRD